MKMNTQILELNPSNSKSLKESNAPNVIQKGGLVAFPTETVYGLGADALNTDAINKIFQAKGRPQDNPLIVHISNFEDLHILSSNIPHKAQRLAEKFWPGPLTMILKRSESVPSGVSAGMNTIAIRMPSNPIALALIKYSNTPIAAPSANLSTRPSPTKAKHVVDDLKGKIDMIIDGGDVEIGVESTVIDLISDPPEILRPGKISKQEIENVIGEVNEVLGTKTTTSTLKPKSPGMKYKHYSPFAKVIIVTSPQECENVLQKNSLKKTKVLKYTDEVSMAKNMFSDFRQCDTEEYELILVYSIKGEGLARAVMNRLEKASSD